MSKKDLTNRLADCLERFTDMYPAFRIKPVGAPGSPARIESENKMELESLANDLIKEARKK